MSNVQIDRLSGHKDGVMRWLIVRTGKWLASGSFDATVKIWDAASHEVIKTLEGRQNMVFNVAFSRDSKLLVLPGQLIPTVLVPGT